MRVLLANLENKDFIRFSGTYYLRSEEARYEFGSRNRTVNIVPLENGLQLYNENRNLLYRQHFPIILSPADRLSRFEFRGKTYEGQIIFLPAPQNGIYLINSLPLEDYLKGVVPAEIFTNKESYINAVMAQAVCARTYALKKLQANKDKPFDVQASTADQVYDGFERHSRIGDQAVGDTHGFILNYNNEPATVYYHSTCGGKLEAAVNVWPGSDMPYLQGGVDAAGQIFSCSASPYFRWTKTRSITQLDSSFYRLYGRGFGMEEISDTLQTVFDMSVTGRTGSGRINNMEISYADTSLSLSNYEIRRFLAPSGGSLLPSTLFYVTQSNDTTVTLYGGGNGHGVGMCQFGAMNMSERGFKYYHILDKYFPGTNLTKVY